MIALASQERSSATANDKKPDFRLFPPART